MTEVETQLVEACESSFKDPTSRYPFGIAMIGTYMKVFQRVNAEWRDTMPCYVDADSGSGHMITTALNDIKRSVQTQPQVVQQQTQQTPAPVGHYP
jgi:hypothetical protein